MYVPGIHIGTHLIATRADSRLAPSQWETSLQCKAVFHWLGANLESALTTARSSLSLAFHRRFITPLHWRHNERDGVSNHQPHGCLLNRLFRHRSTKTSKVRFTGLRAGNSPVTGEFPAQMASNAENVSIWWRHHGQGKATLLRSIRITCFAQV